MELSVGAIIFIVAICAPAFLSVIDLFWFLIKNKRLFSEWIMRILEFLVIICFPVFFFAIDGINEKIDCCNSSPAFSPDHIFTLVVFIGLSIIAYYCSSFKDGILSPLLEVIINCLLLIGVLFNVLMALHIYQVETALVFIGNVPITALFLTQLIKNHREFLQASTEINSDEIGQFEKWGWKILKSELWIKIPLLMGLIIPIITIVSAILMLFGQKPDSAIQAFTQTYKHGFSQLDYLCAGVNCGEHFLCSVAAGGHKNIVKPIRYGERGGKIIICNRQLLISNAFEEWIQQHYPWTHKKIRHHYNKVGKTVHKYYFIFNNKFVADTIYILMKPLEWLFVLVLYTVDKKPENRIARQYISIEKQKLCR